MKHLSQIFTSRTYKVLTSYDELKGKTVIGVFYTNTTTMIVTNGSILFIYIDGGILELDEVLVDTELIKTLELKTAITADQLM